MASSISSNISAYYAQSNLTRASDKTQTSISRLSSGNRITRASDDVAALSIGTILRTDVSTLKTALVNANQGTTLLQIADGALARVGEILQRQKALSTQALSGTLGTKERGYLDQEFQALKTELDRIAGSTNFNGINLIDGNLTTNTSVLATEAPTAFMSAVRSTDLTVSTTVLGSANAIGFSAAGTGDTINSFVGSLEEATVTGYLATDGSDDDIRLVVNFNGINYRSAVIATDAGAAINNVVFTATDGSGAAFTLDLADPASATTFTGGGVTLTQAQTYADLIQDELQKLNVYATRTLEDTLTTDSSAIDSTKFDGSVLQGMDGSDLSIVGKDFSTTDGFSPSITSFKFTSLSSTAFKAEVIINGVTYSTANKTSTADGVTINNDADFTNEDISGVGNGILRLVSSDDDNSYVDISLINAAATLDGRSQSLLDGIQEALNSAFGTGSSGGAEFAIGTDSSDTITVAIDSVKTNALYKDEDGTLNTLDITTKANAVTASDVLDLAIQRVTAARANVGALQSRFSYAAAAIEVSVQNLDAARGVFLDADVSEESTNFATAQVLQQASISVLAQANQLPQNLLKLIG